MSIAASWPDAKATSLWEDVSPRYPFNDPLRGDHRVDVVVIGGGYTGLSTALHLAQAGHSVALLEAREIGWGGSGRNNGQVIPVLAGAEPEAITQRFGDTGARFVALVRDSAQFLFDLAAEHGIDCEAEQAGWFQPAHTPAHLSVSEARCTAWAAVGAPCEMLDKPAGDRLLGSGFWHGGMLNAQGGHINPLMLARGLAEACKRAGVQVFEDSPVSSITRENGRWAVSAGTGRLHGETVVQATGAYGGPNGRLARSVVPLTAWQLATEPLSDALQREILPARQAMSDTRNDLYYFRWDARGRLITGAAMMVPVSVTNRLQTMLRARLLRAYPQVGPLRFSHIWSGYVGVTPDHFPHFHRLDTGYFAATGFNGRGVALAVSAGRELAQLVGGEPDVALPFSDLHPIPMQPALRRVARGALVYYRWKDRQKP